MRSVIIALALLSGSMLGISSFGLQVSEQTDEGSGDCSPPVEMEDDPRFLIERCSDATCIIDTEDGSRNCAVPGSCRVGDVVLSSC